MPPKQHSRPLASALHQVTAKIYRKRGFAAAGVVNNWPAIVGPQLARHTMPERLGADGTLRLRVDGPLATELQHLEPQILEKIAQYFGYRAVHRLRLIQGPLEKKPPPATPAPTPELDSDSAKTLAGTLEGTRNAAVKNALARLGKAVLGQARNT
jgi:hypothetical protein